MRLALRAWAVVAAIAIAACGPSGSDKAPLANGGIAGSGGAADDAGGGVGGSNIDGSGQDGSGVIELVALFAGAEIQGGAPKAQKVAPTGEAPPGTLVVAIFSESVSPATVNDLTFSLREDSGAGDPFSGGPFGGGGDSVTSTIVFPDGTGKRVAVLLPSQPLDETDYSIRLSEGVTDLEGKGLKVSGGGDSGDPTGGFGGLGGAADSYPLSVDGEAPFGVVSMYPLPGSKHVPRDTPILLFFNDAVGQGVINSITVTADGQDVAGKAKTDGDARIVRFTPKVDLPAGSSVEVHVDVPGTFIGFDGQFTVSTIPVPTSINLPNNAPLGFGGVEFDGRVTSENVKDFGAVVNLSKGGADSVTLLFFQQQGLQSGAARAFTKKGSGGKSKFGVNLSKGGDDAQFRDSNDLQPPVPVLLGAFATKDGQNSPVGPMPDLLSLFVKTTKPKVTLGPPTPDGAPFVLRHELARPVVYGTATETLASFRALSGVTSLPVEFLAIPFEGPASVTDARFFFMTSPAQNALPGFPAPEGPMFLPQEIDEITFTDVVGNEIVRKGEKAGVLLQEGSVGGALAVDSMDGLRVRVVREKDLTPLPNVDVQVGSALDPALPPVMRSSGKSGEVGFQPGELSVFTGPLVVTAFKAGYDSFSLVGVANPARSGERYGVSVILEKSGKSGRKVTVHRSGHVPLNNPADAFAGVAGTSLVPLDEFACSACGPDSRFVLQDVGEAAGARLTLDRTRPTVVSAFEHDGVVDLGAETGDYAFRTSEVLIPTDDVDFPVSFGSTVAVHPLVPVTLPVADVIAAGLVEDPASAVRGRIIGVIDGLAAPVPFSFASATSAGGVSLTVRPPLPRSLFLDEPLLKDPQVELLLHPASGADLGAPPEDVLEARFRVEVEAAEAGSSRLTRVRAPLDFDLTTNTAAATPSDLGGFLLPLPVVNAAREQHPPLLQFANHAAYDPNRSLYRVVLRRPGDSRRWTLLIDPGLIDPGTPELALPALPLKPFKNPGDFELTAEVLEFDAIDFDAFVFSDLERLHRRLARGAGVVFNTEPAR